MKKLIYIFFLSFFASIFAQGKNYSEKEVAIGKFTIDTLIRPKNMENPPLVIFIQGSGPTQRNGNQPMMKSDFVKKIARELVLEEIASFSFDKRVFKILEFGITEEDLHFEGFIKDVQELAAYFTSEEKYSEIILAGHREGSLIGILAKDKNIDVLISLAGAGSMDKIIVDQIAKQAPKHKENARQAFDQIIKKGKTENYNPALESIFRPSMQPYMAFWIAYKPSEEISKIKKTGFDYSGYWKLNSYKRQSPIQN